MRRTVFIVACCVVVLAAFASVFRVGAASGRTANCGGGDTLASAVDLVYGSTIGSPGEQSCAGAATYRLTASASDLIVADVNSRYAVGYCFVPTTTTDFTLDQTLCNPWILHDGGGKHEYKVRVPRSGNYFLIVASATTDCMMKANGGLKMVSLDGCANRYGGDLTTLHLLTATKMTLTGPSSSSKGSTLVVRGTISGLSGASAPVRLQTFSRTKSWLPLARMAVNPDGTFSWTTRVTVPGTYTFRAVFDGDGSHQSSSATFHFKVTAH